MVTACRTMRNIPSSVQRHICVSWKGVFDLERESDDGQLVHQSAITGHKKTPMLVFEGAKLFLAKGSFCPSGLLHFSLLNLKTDVANDVQKSPTAAEAAALKSRDEQTGAVVERGVTCHRSDLQLNMRLSVSILSYSMLLNTKAR